jgi:hypothetical protein
MYYLHAFNARGEMLRQYSADTREYDRLFAETGEYDTAVWATGRSAGIASGWIQRTQSAPVGVRTEWKRNRIAYFELWHGGTLLARIVRESTGARIVAVVPSGVHPDSVPDARYTVGKAWNAPGYTAFFERETISSHADPLDAYAACRAHRTEWARNCGLIPETAQSDAPAISAAPAPETATGAAPAVSEAQSDPFGHLAALDSRAADITRGEAWLNDHFPGWREMIEGSDGYSADQLALIAARQDSQGEPNAIQWIESIAQVRRERAIQADPYWYERAQLSRVANDHGAYAVKITSAHSETKWLSIAADQFNGVRAALAPEPVALPDGFEPSPYWPDVDVYAVTVDNESTGALGIIVYRADDGTLLEFTPVEGSDADAPVRALLGIGYNVRPVNARSLGISDEEWRYYADPCNWPPTSERFSNGLAERLWDISMDGCESDAMGDSGVGFGHHSLFISAPWHGIMSCDSQGFIYAEGFESERDARARWDEMAREYERLCMAAIEDAFPTGECDGIFLIFDTARHYNSTPDRERIREHVSECELCGEYRYVLDEF